MQQVAHLSQVSQVQEATACVLPLPEDGLLQLKDVLQFIKVGKSTWWNWVNQGIAPKPKRVGSMTMWRASDIRLFILGCDE